MGFLKDISEGKDVFVAIKKLVYKNSANIWAVSVVSAYIIGGIFVFDALENGGGNNASPPNNSADWTLIDCWYFLCFTFCTIGYGDLYPTSDGSRLFAIFMILVGVSTIFPTFANYVIPWYSPLTEFLRKKFNERIKPPKQIDIDGDGTDDYEIPMGIHLYFAVGLIPSIFVCLVCQLICAGIYVAIENVDTYKVDGSLERQAWGYGDAFYHCMVTATTVGYGDVKIATQAGRLFAGFHMIVSVIMVGEVLTTIKILQTERAQKMKKHRAIMRELDLKLYRKLIARAQAQDAKTNIFFKGKDIGNGEGPGSVWKDVTEEKGIDELQYAILMLLETGLLENFTKVHHWICRFKEWDRNADGLLTQEEFEEELRQVRGKAKQSVDTLQNMTAEHLSDLDSSDDEDGNESTHTPTAPTIRVTEASQPSASQPSASQPSTNVNAKIQADTCYNDQRFPTVSNGFPTVSNGFPTVSNGFQPELRVDSLGRQYTFYPGPPPQSVTPGPTSIYVGGGGVTPPSRKTQGVEGVALVTSIYM